MTNSRRATRFAFWPLVLITTVPFAVMGGQASPQPTPGAPPTVAEKEWTTEADHRNMLDQLGIRALRPGPSGDPKAPNAANYDEALANPFPKLPPVLTLKNGRAVTNAGDWWQKRRPEIVEDFEREIVGRVPKTVPRVTWTVLATTEATAGGHAVLGRQLVGHVDNSAYSAVTVDIQMIVVTPADVKGPVPVLIMFGGRGLPGLPGFTFPGAPAGRPPGPPGPPPAPPPGADPPPAEQLIAAGWGYVTLNPASIQADDGAGLTKGHHRPGQQGTAAQARRLGRTARVGLGRVARARLPRERHAR